MRNFGLSVYDRSRAVEGRAHGLRIAYLCMCVAHDQSRSRRRKLSPFSRVLVLQVYEAAVFNRVYLSHVEDVAIDLYNACPLGMVMRTFYPGLCIAVVGFCTCAGRGQDLRELPLRCGDRSKVELRVSDDCAAAACDRLET